MIVMKGNVELWLVMSIGRNSVLHKKSDFVKQMTYYFPLLQWTLVIETTVSMEKTIPQTTEEWPYLLSRQISS